MPLTILFDFDYTLADSSAGICICVNHALAHMDLPTAEPEAICRTIGSSLRDTFYRLTGRRNSGEPERFIKLFVAKADEVMAAHTYMLPGLPHSLQRLNKAGMRLGIVSTKYRYRIRSILERDQLNDYFDVIVGGEDVSAHKPDPEGLLSAVRQLKVNAAGCLYVGDSAADGEAARRARMPFAAVLSGKTTAAELAVFAPRWIMPDVTYLPTQIEADT